MTTELAFVRSLPPDTLRRNQLNHHAVAEQLRRHVGEWALVTTSRTRKGAHEAARRIRLGLHAAYLPAYSHDAEVRTSEAGVHQVWARRRVSVR
ncbi:hypothetical protein [Marinitenerispora sediminis]|uniref:Uncharacterized protein n=1 Tax=Marinitenerispora sediminis TaxID=1931232 RepID=A0A368T6R6_9ACTN|nr:hypothetical protein [Marinitenerispora sediminis]RCV59332.1 hypothetical protein DEF24_10190 [Marinitenerispora sediminis]